VEENNVIYVEFDYPHNRIVINNDVWGVDVLENIIKLRKEKKVIVSKITDNGLIRIVKIGNKIIDISKDREVSDGRKI
jgi:hypothetical protein